MLCSRGQLLLMLDSDGASKITDLEKLEAQVSVLSMSGRFFCGSRLPIFCEIVMSFNGSLP